MAKEVKYKDPNCYNEAVIAYRDQFELMPNRGFRQDIAVTVKTYEDLCIWNELLSRWGYTDRKTGKWKKRSPLDVKGMLTCFEFKQREAQRKKDELAAAKTQQESLRISCRQSMAERSVGRVSQPGMPVLLDRSRRF